jgi:hypothetical protein
MTRTEPSDVLFQAAAEQDYLTFVAPDLAQGLYDISVTVQTGPDRGEFRLEVSDSLSGDTLPIGAAQDTYSAETAGGQVKLAGLNGFFHDDGPQYVRLRVTGRDAASSGYALGIDQLTFTPRYLGPFEELPQWIQTLLTVRQRLYDLHEGRGQHPVWEPEIAVSGNGVGIADGDATPDTIDDTDFGEIAVGQVKTQTFTIENAGQDYLELGAISITGPAAEDFFVAYQPPAYLPVGGTASFDVQFTASAPGVRNATISFDNNDADEAPFDFVVQGAGIAQPVTVEFETAPTPEASDPYDIRLSAGDVLFRATSNGDSITFAVPDLPAGSYDIAVTVEAGRNRGIFQLESSASLDGTYVPHGEPEDTYVEGFQGGVVLDVASAAEIETSGTRYFRFRIVGKNPSSNARFLALDSMTLTP